MPFCCVSSCPNSKETNNEVKFYRIPSSFSSHRRRLWLETIQKVNGSSENLKGDVRVCSAHFISGEASRDPDNPDFVPSVFKDTKQKSKRRRAKQYMGGRKRKRNGAKNKTGDTTPRAGSPEELRSAELTEETETPFPESKKKETLTEDAEAETKTKEITPQTPLSPNEAVPSCEARVSILQMDKKLPVVLLKPVFTPALGYRCQECIENFPTVSEFLKHIQLHQAKSNDCESYEQPFTSQDDSDKIQQVQEPSFPCNICDRSFTSSHHLKRHKLLHVKDGRKCHVCGVLFCQRHNHVLYLPQSETVVEFEEDSSITEPEVSPSQGQESNHISDTDDKTQSPKIVTLLLATSPQNSPSASKHPRPLSKTGNPLPPPSHSNVLTGIPLPVLQKVTSPPHQTTRYSNSPRAPTEFRHLLPQHSSAISQPRYPQDIELPPSLQVFSPKYLTSPFFEVTRNFDYILNKQRDVRKLKEKSWEVPISSQEGQSISSEKEDSYLDVVF